MEKKAMLKSAVKTFTSVKLGGEKGDAKLAELDRGILEVALMIAGLDGSIFPDEYEAFATMVKKCRGASVANTKAVFDSATAKAGQLVSMARSGLYSEAARLAAFVKLSREALPKGFAYGSLADIRRAFALFTAMGVSDGAFSLFEKKCVKMLLRLFVLSRAGKAKSFGVVLESDFFAKAERIFRDMKVESRCAKAEKALADLIAHVSLRTRGGVAHHKSAALSLPLPGPVITGWK